MTREELLKELEKLPKIETNNPVSTMNAINVDDLMNAVDRLNKIPNYNDLLKENQDLKKQYEKRTKMYQNAYNYSQKMEGKAIILETQQKEFIKYLEVEINKLKKEYGNYVYDDYSEEKGKYDTCMEILQKYKEIIGDDK